MFLRIDHITEYRYRQAVELTPHLLRLLPRSSAGLHLLSSEVSVSPKAMVRWNLDLEGNIVGLATFPEASDCLRVSSSLLIEQKVTNPFDFLLEGRGLNLPPGYTEREMALLTPFLTAPDPETSLLLDDWLKPFLNGVAATPSTLGVLTALNRAIPALFRYTTRHEEGIRSVEETLRLGEGTCRDFAHLFMEAARSLHIAARYVSGYLCSAPDGTGGDAHTHGWCELYLPGAGWRGFDPTNGILAGPHHIAVATSLLSGELPPVEGSYCGQPGLCVAHEVSLSARELLPGEET